MSHYYEKLESGVVVPRHFVPMKSRDALRPTTINDFKKWVSDELNIGASVTTVLDVLAKPGLVNWKIDQHLEQALIYALEDGHLRREYGGDDQIFEELLIDFLTEVKRRTELQMDKAPSDGTDVHKSLEEYFSYTGVLDKIPEKHWKICRNVAAKIAENCGSQYWEPEVSFLSEANGYKFGGQADLVSDGWIIDFKTKNDKAKWKPGKMIYQDHHRQLAAYNMGLIGWRRCAIVMICIPTGEVEFTEITEEQLEKGWRVFENALECWYIDKGII